MGDALRFKWQLAVTGLFWLVKAAFCTAGNSSACAVGSRAEKYSCFSPAFVVIVTNVFARTRSKNEVDLACALNVRIVDNAINPNSFMCDRFFMPATIVRA